jgi:hypothetical protein
MRVQSTMVSPLLFYQCPEFWSENIHDDLVLAVALACWIAEARGGGIVAMYSPLLLNPSLVSCCILPLCLYFSFFPTLTTSLLLRLLLCQSLGEMKREGVSLLPYFSFQFAVAPHPTLSVGVRVAVVGGKIRATARKPWRKCKLPPARRNAKVQ